MVMVMMTMMMMMLMMLVDITMMGKVLSFHALSWIAQMIVGKMMMIVTYKEHKQLKIAQEGAEQIEKNTCCDNDDDDNEEKQEETGVDG